MATRDHEPISFNEFLGTFDRGEDEVVPPGYFKDSRNVRFINGGVETRGGTALSITLASVKRAAIYKRIGEAPRLLLLDATGQLWDSTNLVTPILSIASMSDFSMVSMFNRAYITPHNGLKGLPGEKVYVYSGSGLARAAAGTAPSGFSLGAAESGSSGNCEAGDHVYAVAFETESGFISGYGGYVRLTQTGGFQVDLSALPLGPAGTAARVLVATKRILAFNGDFVNQTYYFVPNGRIAGNVVTTATVSFFDADLVDEASYLADQLSEIPAGVGIGIYRGRLITWGEDANDSVIRASVSGEPESHSATEGFITVNPGDSGGGVRNCAEYRTQLLAFKGQRTYVTQDNNNNPVFWEVTSLDMSIGTECHGIGKVLDFGESLQDRLFVADRAGLQLFAGTFSDTEITFPISDIWDRITKAHFHTVEVAVDPIASRVYIAAPLDGATAPSHLIVGDFQNGLSVDKIRWTLWSFPAAPQTVVVDVDNTTKEAFLRFGVAAGNVYDYDEDETLDFGATAIDNWVEFPLLPQGDDYPFNHFAGIRLRIKGTGNLQITLAGLDAVTTSTAPSLALSAAPGKPLWRGFNFKNERCAVKLRMSNANERFTLTHFSLFYKILWTSRPE